MKTDRKARILVIDDEENIRKSLKMILEYEGFEFLEAGDGEDGLQMLDENVGIDIVLLDIKMPGRDGLEILSEIKARPFVARGHHDLGPGHDPDGRRGDQARGLRVPGEAAPPRPRPAEHPQRPQPEQAAPGRIVDLRRKAEKRYELIGNHPLMKKLWKEILKTAPTNATVLIHGESGTGKELIARAIHAHSLRAKEPFVQVNCAAIPEELIE